MDHHQRRITTRDPQIQSDPIGVPYRRRQADDVIDSLRREQDREGEDVAESFKSILESAVPLRERRAMRDRYVQRGGFQTFAEMGFEQVQIKSRWWRSLGQVRLWKSSLWKVESKFGNSVVAFFDFMKWTMGLNLVSSILVLLIILTPHLVEEGEDKTDTLDLDLDTCYYVNNTFVPLANVSDCCSDMYEERTESFHFDTANFFGDLLSLFQDLLQGTGFVENTPLFYGYYEGTAVFDIYGVVFDFPLSYILVMLAIFVLNLAAVVFSSAKSFYSSTHRMDSANTTYTNLVFGR